MLRSRCLSHARRNPFRPPKSSNPTFSTLHNKSNSRCQTSAVQQPASPCLFPQIHCQLIDPLPSHHHSFAKSLDVASKAYPRKRVSGRRAVDARPGGRSKRTTRRSTVTVDFWRDVCGYRVSKAGRKGPHGDGLENTCISEGTVSPRRSSCRVLACLVARFLYLHHSDDLGATFAVLSSFWLFTSFYLHHPSPPTSHAMEEKPTTKRASRLSNPSTSRSASPPPAHTTRKASVASHASNKKAEEIARIDALATAPGVSMASFAHLDEKAILRKMDLRLIPMLALLYLLSFLDRGNIGNAKIEGLTEDLGMSGAQYNWCLTVRSSVYELDVRHTLTSYLHLPGILLYVFCVRSPE